MECIMIMPYNESSILVTPKHISTPLVCCLEACSQSQHVYTELQVISQKLQKNAITPNGQCVCCIELFWMSSWTIRPSFMKCLVSCEEATRCNDPCPMHHIFLPPWILAPKDTVGKCRPRSVYCLVKYGST